MFHVKHIFAHFNLGIVQALKLIPLFHVKQRYLLLMCSLKYEPLFVMSRIMFYKIKEFLSYKKEMFHVKHLFKFKERSRKQDSTFRIVPSWDT